MYLSSIYSVAEWYYPRLFCSTGFILEQPVKWHAMTDQMRSAVNCFVQPAAFRGFTVVVWIATPVWVQNCCWLDFLQMRLLYCIPIWGNATVWRKLSPPILEKNKTKTNLLQKQCMTQAFFFSRPFVFDNDYPSHFPKTCVAWDNRQNLRPDAEQSCCDTL